MNALKKEKKNLCLPGSFLCWVSSGWDSTKFTSFLTSTRSHGLSSEFSVEGSREKGWPFLFGEPRATWSPDPAYTGLMEREFAAINFCLSFFPLPGGPLHIRAVVFAKNTPGWRSMKVPIHAFHSRAINNWLSHLTMSQDKLITISLSLFFWTLLVCFGKFITWSYTQHVLLHRSWQK